jgi:CcmD family protein
MRAIRRAWTAAAALLGALAAWPAGALAQGEWQTPAAVPEETLAASPLVFAAYAFVWAAVVVYVGLLWRRLARVEKELADVRAKLAAGKGR